MKKLALIIVTASMFATPVFACPHEEGAAPKTAEKAKDSKTDTKAKEQPQQPKQNEGTSTAKTKTKGDTAKKPAKVSQK